MSYHCVYEILYKPTRTTSMHSFISSIDMGRGKFRFDNRKNLKRLKMKLIVSIPLSLLPAPQFVVSFPISSFTSRLVSDGAHLHSQLSKLQSLSPWSMQSPSAETPLVLFKLECPPPLCTPQIVFSVKVCYYALQSSYTFFPGISKVCLDT